MPIRQTSIQEAYLAAFSISQQSKDDSTKVGCVIMTNNLMAVASGFNSFPRGVDVLIPSRHARPAKYDWTVHAEMNALAECNTLGIRTGGCYLFCTQIPCPTCMGMIIQCHISKVICPNPSQLAEKWIQGSIISKKMAEESGIDLFFREPPPKELYEAASDLPR